MKRRRKIAVALVALLLLSQAPFAYRSYRLWQLGAAVDELNARRVPALPGEAPFKEYVGVFHVHSFLGGHSKGTLEEIVRAAKSERLDFVLMTEHPQPQIDTAAATLRGFHDGVLFVGGSELVASDGGRLFVVPGVAAPDRNPPLQELVTRAKSEERLAVVGYPEEVRNPLPTGFDGIEVYNLYTNAKRINYATMLFDGLWSYWGRPELLFARFYERPAENLRRWDEYNASGAGRAYAFAGNDAHANVGWDWQDEDGRKVFDFKLDPYERSFRLVRIHVYDDRDFYNARGGDGEEPYDEQYLLGALRRGNFYLAFDVFGDPNGFSFTAAATRGSESWQAVMGGEIPLPPDGEVRLKVTLPVQARTVFYRDGQVVHEVPDATRAYLIVKQKGVYRVEVYLDQLGSLLEGKPWIISNPIFVR
ncbi:MAG: hypothetical protein JOZ96_11100 [Acidobacteria bacterium]|nr:hypothetical protein [Acidobacteriota bacterium]